jgi:acyl dehydratase
MRAVSNFPDWLRAVLALAGYSVLFAQTIRRNRANRPIVLGVCTVIMFMGFLITATLRGQPLFRVVVTLVTIGLGFLVLFFVGQDVFRWARRQASSGSTGLKTLEPSKRIK